VAHWRLGPPLSLIVDQGSTARILALFTFRPDFVAPWTGRGHVAQITLNRLARRASHLAREGGAIVNISSITGLVGSPMQPAQAAAEAPQTTPRKLALLRR